MDNFAFNSYPIDSMFIAFPATAQMSWFVQNAEPPKIATEDELLDEGVNDDTMATEEIRLEDEEDDEETEDRSWRR